METSKDEAAIRALFDRYSDCIVNHDGDGWMALWDENGAQLPPESPMFVGKAEVKRGNYGWITDRSGIWTMHIHTQEVKVFPAEGYAFARGGYDWTLTPKAGGEASRYDGKFMTIFHRQDDGKWLIFRDCFNSNVPAGAGPGE